MQDSQEKVFGVEEEELYNKCLFKQIPVHDLENEIKERNIACTQSDTYHIMTTKLQLDILEKCEALPSVREDLKNVIGAFYSTGVGSVKKSVYGCCLSGCKFQTKDHKNYVKHLAMHGSIPHKLVCQLKGCKRELTNLAMLKIHIKTCHWPRRISMISIRQNQMVEELVQLRCLQTSCEHQTVHTVADLKKHLKKHTDKCEMVCCPFDGCNFEANVSATLRVHFWRKHPVQQVDNLKAVIVTNATEGGEENCVLEPISESKSCDAFDDEYDDDDYEEEVDFETVNDEAFENEEVFLKSLAMVFNNWMNVAGIPYSTVNMIVSEVFRSYNMGVEVTKHHVKRLLKKEGIEAAKVEEILEKVVRDDPFIKAQLRLEKEKKRLKFLQEAFETTPPETIRLNPIHEAKAETYQYVSLKSSLKLLLEDETYIKQRKEDPYFAERGVVKDVRDGSIFRENSYFQENPEAVPLLIFQDELEVCNPLGSGKTKHKINCTYYTTLDVQSALRGRVKSIQLVSLVSSKIWKKYGNLKCNAELLSDLLELESKGLEVFVPERKVVKAALCYIVGDNLGLHQLAELSACFSSGVICRVCQAEYKDVCQKHLVYANCEESFHPESFTKENYDAFANLAEENGEASAETKGIKGHCIFNQLQSYHCVVGMPPCLGHDFYEGVFAYDIQHLITFIINTEKLISVEEFNKKLLDFQLNQRDARNRPNIFKTRKANTKYEGSAGSLRVLGRMITPLLSTILDHSKAGKMLIKLCEVSEIVTAPKLSHYEIDVVMPEIILEYLDFRISAVEVLGMSNPKPKHHFLSHYNDSYRKYGPLILLWGMRMESKHVYFKSVIKAAKNFKNVTKTCAQRHQLAQVSYAYTGLFPTSKFEIPDVSISVEDMKTTTRDPFLMMFLETLDSRALVLKRLKIYGTLYVPGNVLVLKKVSSGALKVGLLKAISFHGEEINFGVTTFMVLQNRYNFHVTTEKLSEFENVKYQDLLDYYPLQRFGTINAFSFSLHHYVSEK